MKKNMKRILALLWIPALLLGLFGCGKTSASKRPPLQLDTSGRQVAYSFLGATGQQVQLSEGGAQAVLAAVEQQNPDYFLSDMYQLDEVEKRLSFDVSVAVHQASALNDAGVLSGSYLAELVKKNNEEFLATKPFGFQAVEDDQIDMICDFVVGVVNAMAQKYPDVDWPRVYCNLGHLKILYDVGMLSYAQVSPEMILSISKNNTSIILTMKGEDGFSRVMTHEIMHIIQIGCVCENIENAGRRAGISMYWDDFTLNTTDWTWMVEGAAERHMCSLTGGEAVTYQYKMDYLCSLTMSVLLRREVRADTMELLTFYDDPELLFEAFDCQTPAQRRELMNMMITLQVLQIQPASFMAAYKEKTGVDLQADEQALNQFFYSLKPAVCITLAKEFYVNLAEYLQENALPLEDVCFLINLFEGHLNQHLTYKNTEKAQINAPFFAAYTAMRTALFEALAQDNGDLDMTAVYEAYQISPEQGKLAASLAGLPEDKRTFLAERAQWQQGLRGLGVKVAQ